jgi:hypothetical protein
MCRKSKRKCLCCRDWFWPDYRNRKRQKYCAKTECRKASKTASQKRWISKPGNQNYFKGALNVQRVQAWRNENPGYWRKKSALQDVCDLELIRNKEKNTNQVSPQAQNPLPLQDSWIMQDPGIIGLISMITGSTLQDIIEKNARHCIQLGLDIVSKQPNFNGDKHANQKNHPSRPAPSGAGTVRLDRPSPGPG